jgi:hypothetical protein
MAENGCGKVADDSEQFCPWLRHVLDNYSVMTAAISVTISQTISSKKTLVLNGTYFYSTKYIVKHTLQYTRYLMSLAVARGKLARWPDGRTALTLTHSPSAPPRTTQ